MKHRRLAGGRERPAVVHAGADQKSCWHFVIEQVNTVFRRFGLIFALEGGEDNPNLATI